MIAQGREGLKSLPKSLRLGLAVFATGIASGLVGIFCHYLLEFIQVLAFGKDKGDLLLLFQSVSAFRRFLVLLVVGVLASLFWYFLQRRVTLLSISKAKKLVGKRSPNFLGQSLHALVQVAIVAAGASIGKEGAPRELGALFGGSFSKGLRLDISDRQLLMACGAGAGLASVYQVPFASALFVIETLGVGWKLKNIVIILVTTYLSAYCARPIVGGQAIYLVDKIPLHSSGFMLAIILAVFVTPLAMVFAYVTKKASSSRITDKAILWTLPLAFLILGGLSAYFPIFMGNGQVLAQWLFSGNSSAYLPVILLIKALLVCLLLRSGAYGGTLTPSFALGVGAGYLITVLLGIFDFSLSPDLGMLLGATIFLGTTLDAPLTGIALVVGFTGTGGVIILPLVLASFLSRIINNKWKEKR
ncbi:chloride channel protein [uncultured Streptococcus sp.]|uniref:chloride channel protein n=1 Tax=uncultured Streptococcus sp. TaxID=83427 RepID=UPI00265AB625|nr:chloride channel protein [uncultured Streptococcus sp.]